MANIQLKQGVSSVSRETSDGTFIPARSTRDGALFTNDWIKGLALEGRVFVANAGTATTALTFSDGSAVDTTEPDLIMTVPSGTTVIPISINIYFEEFGANGALEIMGACGVGAPATVTGGTAVIPTNLRTDAPFKSNCTIYHTVNASGSTYMTVNISEFWRDGAQRAITKATATNSISNWDKVVYGWTMKDAIVPPIVVGDGTLSVFCSGNAGKGFITLVYAEVPSNSIV